MKNDTSKSGPSDQRRRTFLENCAAALAGITVVGFAAPLIQGCEPSVLITDPGNPADTSGTGGGGTGNRKVFDVSTLRNDGDALMTSVKGPDGKPILIVRLGAGNFVALSTECTHERCPVLPPSNDRISCPCHGSKFALNGDVLNGPATRPLKKYPATHDASAGTLTVTVQ